MGSRRQVNITNLTPSLLHSIIYFLLLIIFVRSAALRRLHVALEQFHVVGLHTNLPFLRKLSAHQAFEKGEVETGFIPKYHAELIPPIVPASSHFIALATLATLLGETPSHSAAPLDPHSPWDKPNHFRLNGTSTRTLKWIDKALVGEGKKEKEGEIKVNVTHNNDNTYTLTFGDNTIKVRGQLKGDKMNANIGDTFYNGVTVVQHDGETVVFHQGQSAALHRPLTVEAKGADGQAGSLLSPMPGKIVKVMAKVGDKVAKGTPLVIMEAMKMEHTIRAPAAGVVESMRYNVGDLVEEKKVLVTLATQQ